MKQHNTSLRQTKYFGAELWVVYHRSTVPLAIAYSVMSDEDLVLNAEAIFLELDKQEAANE